MQISNVSFIFGLSYWFRIYKTLTVLRVAVYSFTNIFVPDSSNANFEQT